MIATLLASVGSFAFQHALKATVGALTAATTTVGSAIALNPSPEAQLTLVGYLLVGLLNGGITWVTVYFPANK